jgi:hypothetical protein
MSNNTWKSTRLQWGLVIWIVATVLLYKTLLTSDQWIGMTQWIFSVYAASEVGAKGAKAYKEKV